MKTLLKEGTKWSKAYQLLVIVIASALCLMELGNFTFVPMQSTIFFMLHFMFGLVICFLVFDFKGNATYWSGWKKLVDVLFIAGAIAVTLYIIVDVDSYLTRIQIRASSYDIVMGSITMLLVLEASRRLTGKALTIISAIMVAYAYWGKYIPGFLGHNGYSVQRIIITVFSEQGIFGMPLAVSANTIFLFLLFGAFLNVTGAEEIFRDLSIALAGRKRGGPAKIAVIASTIFGSISGSAIANVASTGAFTIPLMKRVGYDKSFAAAVEAVSSTGGQIMPPVMGAAAFVLAEMTGTPYATVCLTALIPALLYYGSLFVMVDVEALKNQLGSVPKDEIPELVPVLKRSAKLMVPLLVLTISLVILRNTPMKSAIYATLSAVICSLFDSKDRFSFGKLLRAFLASARSAAPVVAACCCSGIVISMLSVTGLGLKFSNLIFKLGGNNLLLSLLVSMFVSIVLGMGLPTTPAYIITATTIAPALLKLGLPMLPAHLFLMYFACISQITPPVALASYTAAALSDAKPMRVGLLSVKLGIVAFLIPYAFVFKPAIIGFNFSTVWGALDVILSALLTLLAALPIGYAVQGFAYKKLNIAIRILLVAIAVCLIYPSLLVEVPAAILLIAFWLFSKKQHKNSLESAVSA